MSGIFNIIKYYCVAKSAVGHEADRKIFSGKGSRLEGREKWKFKTKEKLYITAAQKIAEAAV